MLDAFTPVLLYTLSGSLAMPSQKLVCLALAILAHAALLAAEGNQKACDEQTCLTDVPTASAGSQLMQFRSSKARLKEMVECSDAKFGKIIPLDDKGFMDVEESCCYDDMKEFIRRLAKGMELKVCHEGGLSGFAPFFSCSNRSVTFMQLQHDVREQAKHSTRCRWLGHAAETCQPLAPECGVSTNPLDQKTVLKGYIGLDAENNPPALVTNPEIKSKIRKDVADDLGVPESAVRIEVGTGPIGSAGLYQVAMKSLKTGKYVELGSEGDLVASSTDFKTVPVKHEQGNVFLVSGGSTEVRVTWNKDTSSFQTEGGEHAVEDSNGHVVFGARPDSLFQVSFPGFGSSASGSLETQSESFLAHERRRSCTVTVSFEVLQTEPPSLDPKKVQETAATIDVARLESLLSHDLDAIEACLGKLEISTFKFCKEKGACKNKSLRNAHSDREYNHEGSVGVE